MKIIERIKKSKLLFFVALAYGTLFIVVPETAVQSFGNSVYYLKEMLEILPVIFLLTVIIEAWVPKEVIMKRFG
ncbi:MAG: permease, partial [Firmicutes bacterium]|nr:permease [Bacillota bacterium]